MYQKLTDAMALAVRPDDVFAGQKGENIFSIIITEGREDTQIFFNAEECALIYGCLKKILEEGEEEDGS